MKLLLVTTAFPRWANDHQAVFLLEEARFLNKLGANVSILAMHNPGSRIIENINGINVYRTKYLPEKLEVLRKEEGGLPTTWLNRPFVLIGLIPFLILQTLKIIILAGKNDILHAQWSLSGVICWWSKFIHRRPYIITVHGSDLDVAARLPLVKGITRRSLMCASKVIAVSSYLAQACVDLGVREELIATIPDGVNIDQFTPGPVIRDNYILFVGALLRDKGVYTLLDAMPYIWRYDPDMKLVMVGDGPERIQIQKKIRELDVPEKVELLGILPQGDVCIKMQHAKIFALPSTREGFGVVLLEALACGTPCVASRVGGIPDIIDKNVGVLIEPGNPEGLANAVLQIVRDPDNYRSMALRARKRVVEHFDWNVVSERLINEYQIALRSNK